VFVSDPHARDPRAGYRIPEDVPLAVLVVPVFLGLTIIITIIGAVIKF